MTNATKEKTNRLVWRTEQRKVSDLIPNPQNPRKMSEKQAEELKKSVEKFNLAEIPAINTDNKIVAGHMRVATLQLLGRGDEVIDVRVPSRKLTDKEYREYLLRSNQNRGDWDWDVLANSFDINELTERHQGFPGAVIIKEHEQDQTGPQKVFHSTRGERP